MKNSDVRVCAIEHGVRMWELADQLGISPETLSRKLRRELKASGGFDLLLAHSPVAGLGDQPDLPHRGFECFKPLLSQYHPRVMFHGHVHKAYSGASFQREREWDGIPVINACGSYIFDWPDEWLIDTPLSRWALRRIMKLSQPGEENEHF